MAALKLRRARRVGLPRDVHEAAPSVRESGLDLRRIESQQLRCYGRLPAHVLDEPRVRVHGRRLLADRELHAPTVEDRSARRGNGDVLAVLARGYPPERARAHSLQPGRTKKRNAEREREDREQQPDAAVGGPPAPPAPCPPPPQVVLGGAAGA